MCSAACRRTARSRADEIKRALDRAAAPRRLRAAAARHRLPFRRPGRARSQGGRRHRRADRATPIRCARRSIRNCSARPKPRCRKGSRATRSTPAASSSRPPRPIWPRPSVASRPTQKPRAKTKPAWQQALTGRPAAALRRALAGGGGDREVATSRRRRDHPGRPRGRARPAAVGRQGSIQRSLKLYDVVLRARHRGQGQDGRARRAARAAAGAGRRRRAREQDRPHPRHGRRLLLSAEPAQPRHPVAAPAGLGAQAAHLSRGAAEGPAAQHAGARRADHAAADQRQIAAREEDYWTPKNYDGGAGGIVTLRRALENSKNLATVNLLDGGIDPTPALSLDRICALAIEAQIYQDCVRYYPFVLGAQPVRPIDLAAFYAAIANEGVRPTPYAIESIEHNGNVVYQHTPSRRPRIGSADRVSFYQLKTMLQGVLARGTAHAIASLAPYVAGKTGTTDGENDAWFVGFTNDVTVAVWVGYDNADGKRRTLGGGQTGASVAIPIFEPIIQAVWAYHSAQDRARARRRRRPKRSLVARGRASGDEDDDGGKGSSNISGATGTARRADTRYQLVARDEDSPIDRERTSAISSPWSIRAAYDAAWAPAMPRSMAAAAAAAARGASSAGSNAVSAAAAPATAAAALQQPRRQSATTRAHDQRYTRQRHERIPITTSADDLMMRIACLRLAALLGLALSRPRAPMRRTFKIEDVAFDRGRAGRAAQAEDHRLCRPAERASVDDATGFHALRGLGAHAARSSSSFSASIPATTSPTSTSSSTASRSATAKSCTCMCGEARFLLARPPASLDLARFSTLPFLEQIDPAIKHRLSPPADPARPKEPKTVYNQNPQRRWCEGRATAICMRSAYKLEGRLPTGIALANKIREGAKKISDTLEFDSELALVSAGGGRQAGLAQADRPRHAGDRRARAEHLLCQRGDAVRQAGGRVPAASGRREQDRRDRLHRARDRIEHARQAQGVRAGAGACAIWCRRRCWPARARSTPAIRSAPACRSMPATRSRRSPGLLEAQ